MRTTFAIIAIAGVWAALDVSGYAQGGSTSKVAADASQPQEQSVELAPEVKLEFRPQQPIPGITASPIVASPVLCSPDGTPFVDFPDMSDFKVHAIYSLAPKGAVLFSSKSITGLYDLTYQSFFPGDSTVLLLMHGTSDSKESTYTVYTGNGSQSKTGAGYRGAHQDYLAEYDRNGSFKSAVELPAGYHFWRVAFLPDGNLLALAYDRANAVPRLLLLDSGGQIIRPLEIPAQLQDSPELTAGETGPEINRARAESSLSWWLFAPSGQKTILYKAHSTAPLLEVGVAGAAREIPLEMPKGYEIDAVVPGNDRLIVRYRRHGLSSSGSIDANPEVVNYVLYQVNPSDGTLLRQLDPGAGPLFNIACEQDGVFTAFSMENDKVIRMTAEVPK